MASKARFRVPRITTPATMYLVRWIDANYDSDYDGPSKDFKSELIADAVVGFHTKTEKDHVVLASSCVVTEGENHSRWHITVPRVHITEMHKLEIERASEKSGSGEVGAGGVSGVEDVGQEVR